MAAMRRFTVILSPDPDLGGFTVLCPAMPGALAEADTREAALDTMARVMATWLEVGSADGYGPLPETPDLVAEKIASVIEDRDASGWDLTIETVMLAPAVVVAA
jgi:predicted RNase H-like HicB family nuclease